MNRSTKMFQIPQSIKCQEDSLTESYGRIVVEPLERGFGATIGNSLRRVLISSIEGAAVVAVKIGGVVKELSSIKGVKEDVTDIILNLKRIRFRLHRDGLKTFSFKIKGHKVITGADIM
ncbi:MAG: DNA-directed RNA polymerase subunit alpha, partial [Nitrospirae bacterium]|nr:DNA-directed RNA polymerase subunit alpha [Nitrospirota bacterium]